MRNNIVPVWDWQRRAGPRERSRAASKCAGLKSKRGPVDAPAILFLVEPLRRCWPTRFSREHLAEREHPERPERFDAVVRGLRQRGCSNAWRGRTGARATEEELLLCHTAEYLRTARQDALSGRPSLSTGDTDITPNSWDVASQRRAAY